MAYLLRRDDPKHEGGMIDWTRGAFEDVLEDFFYQKSQGAERLEIVWERAPE